MAQSGVVHLVISVSTFEYISMHIICSFKVRMFCFIGRILLILSVRLIVRIRRIAIDSFRDESISNVTLQIVHAIEYFADGLSTSVGMLDSIRRFNTLLGHIDKSEDNRLLFLIHRVKNFSNSLIFGIIGLLRIIRSVIMFKLFFIGGFVFDFFLRIEIIIRIDDGFIEFIRIVTMLNGDIFNVSTRISASKNKTHFLDLTMGNHICIVLQMIGKDGKTIDITMLNLLTHNLSIRGIVKKPIAIDAIFTIFKISVP